LVIATPQSEDELARLQRHNKRLEELIEIYEKQFSVDALAALAYPSLAFAHVPLPHAKVLFFCPLSLSLSILYCHIGISVLLGFTWCRPPNPIAIGRLALKACGASEKDLAQATLLAQGRLSALLCLHGERLPRSHLSARTPLHKSMAADVHVAT
jgi:hypothetical protein